MRYVPAEKRLLGPNQFEGTGWAQAKEAVQKAPIYLDVPIATHVRRCITRELEASGFQLTDSAAAPTLTVEITQAHFANRFSSVTFYVKSIWALKWDGKVLSRELIAERHRTSYGAESASRHFNEMVSDLYEQYFADPEVRSFVVGSHPSQ